MGRETKLLLALLATLAGVFVGVLSLKLLVPRPPVGAGPDVAIEGASTGAHELVEPPSFSGRRAAAAQIPAGAFAAAPEHAAPPAAASPPLAVASASGPMPTVEEPPRESPRGPVSAFAPRDIATDAAQDSSPVASVGSLDMPPAAFPAAPRRDPFVAAASHDVAVAEPPRPEPPPAAPPPFAPTGPAVAPGASASLHLAAAGDSWWNLAERAYGDGRLYRALYAWNRVINPRVSLAPGTPLEIPPRPRLEAAWPALVPAPPAAAVRTAGEGPPLP